MKGGLGGKVGGLRDAGDVGVAAPIHRDAKALVKTAPAQVGGKHEGRACRAQLGRDRVITAAQGSLERVLRRIIAGIADAANVSIALAIYRQDLVLGGSEDRAVAEQESLGSTAAQVGGIRQGGAAGG